jgi:penicillin-binding protein 1A
MKKTGIIILKISLVTAGIIVLYILSVTWGLFGHLQSKDELLSFKNATASLVMSDEGDLIGRIFSENRTNVFYGQIPADLINALIATEDARFFQHQGIDSRSLFRVLLKSVLLMDRSAGGGSTITQQLAKNMFGRKNSGRLSIIIIKTKEALLAHRLEKALSKEEILALYLNTVSFGENIFGIEAAAGRYFNKKVELLNIEESAVLVGILKANDFYNPRIHPENAKIRRNVVLRQMEKYKYLEKNVADSLCNLPLLQNYINFEIEGPADYFLYQVRKEAEQILQSIKSENGKVWNIEEDGLLINTTLNLTLQNYANTSFHEHLPVMQKRLDKQYGPKDTTELLQAGLLAVDPETGAVKAWVGGIDFKTQPFDQILARRQLASTFKPVLYAEALEEGMDPCQYLDNDSIILSGFEDWSPENFDHSYGGRYSIAGALAQSMNIPTFNLFLKVDFAKLDSLWKKMGFSFVLNNNPSLALGTAEANLREVAVAYSSFANGGFKVNPQIIESIKSPAGEMIWQNEFNNVKTRVLSERTSQLISAILQKAVREGTGASMHTVFGVNLPLAGKTGTSQNYADAWFAAFNPKLIIVSRVGASSPAIHFNNGSDGSGSALALPLVALTLKQVQSDPELREKLFTAFPQLPSELAAALDCPDFKEKNVLDKFRDLFKKDKIKFDNKPDKNKPKKKPFFKRLFGR